MTTNTPRRRAEAETVPNLQTFVTDTGIPLSLLDVGQGATPRSDATKPRALSEKSVVFSVHDATPDNQDLHGASTLRKGTGANTMAHRNKLAEILSRQDLVDLKNLPHLKATLQALVSENKAKSKSEAPTSLHLYMGFGGVATQDRGKASLLAWRLRENALALKGQLGDAECEQMLGWIADAWEVYERANSTKTIKSGASSSPRCPADMAVQPFMEKADLRDALLEAATAGDVPRAEALLKKVPAIDWLGLGLPADAPDRFTPEHVEAARANIAKFSPPLQAYLNHCIQLSESHRWVKQNIAGQQDAGVLFSPALRNVCDTLRMIDERRLEANFPMLEGQMRALGNDPQLAQRLAEQPFAAIRTMLDKCAVLGNYHEDNAVLRTFRDALEVAQDLQSVVIQSLADELLTGTLDRESLRPMLLRGVAWQVTNAPQASLGTHASVEQRNLMRSRLDALKTEATRGGSQTPSGWEAAVLSALIQPLKTQSTLQTAANLTTTRTQPPPLSRTGTLNARPSPLSDPADILKRATLRDGLMQALLQGNPQAIQSAAARLPAGVDPSDYLPDPAPDKFQETAWAHASAYTLQHSPAVQTYATRSHRLAAWHRWVNHNVQHADAQELFKPSLRRLCDALRTTHETVLATNAGQIERMAREVLTDPRLPQTLAQQPFTSLRAMASKCDLLGAHVRSPALQSLRTALTHAQNLQNTATRALRKELLSDAIDNRKLKPLVLMAFAREATALPSEGLTTDTTATQRDKLVWRLRTLHDLSQLDAPEDDGGFYGAVLNRLGKGVPWDRRTDEQAGTLEAAQWEFGAADVIPTKGQ